jgi:hypothetical protein
LELTHKINVVLTLKTAFWAEATKEEPRIQVLQNVGLETVQRSHALNNFYAETFDNSERMLGTVDATVLFCKFLVSATNFKDYARDLMKKASKRIEDVKLKFNDAVA